MRKCIRCGCEMKENCAVKIEGAGYGIVLSSDENKLFGGRIGKPKVAICPECGEVSIYLEASAGRGVRSEPHPHQQPGGSEHAHQHFPGSALRHR